MPLLLVFCLSGASGLIYQVIWVRELGIHFGSTVHSASLVTALFMLGLGLGSRIAGTLADRRFLVRPGWSLRAYSISELLIAALALLAAIVLPLFGPVFTESATYSVGSDAWHRLSAGSSLLRYLLATVLLLPITLIMGGTLTLLIRHRVRATGAEAGRDVAALYGANTLGAAIGALLTDLWLVPAVGLFQTQLIAAGLNVVAGLGALLLVSRGSARPEIDKHTEVESKSPRVLIAMAVVLATTGFVSMGMEMLWFRHLSSLLGSQRLVFSLLLATMLISMWIGTAVASGLLARGASPRAAYAGLQMLFVASALGGLYFVGSADIHAQDAALREVVSVEATWTWRILGLELIWKPMLWAVVLPSAAMGASFPLANAAAQRALGSVGRRAGTLYLANSVGAALGSLVAGFVLLPWLGLQHTAIALAALSVGAIGILLVVRGEDDRAGVDPRVRIVPWSAAAVPVFLVFGFFASLPSDTLLLRTIPSRLAGSQVVAVREGTTETIIVTEHPNSGRRLLTNGFSMSGTSWGGQRYMRLFAHLPLLQMEAASKAAVICFGVGNTLHAASLHPLETIEVIDLSEDILKFGHHFSATNHGALMDPKVRVFVNDGRQHLRMSEPGSYDLVTAEPPPLGHAGVAALYSLEFYQIVERSLRPGGWFTQWLPIYQLTESMARSVIATFLAVFPEAVLLSGDRAELILVGVKGEPTRVDFDRLKRLISARPAVAADLEANYLGTASELIGTFAGGPAALRRATQAAPLVTDDQPLMEYQTAIFAPRRRLPSEIFDISELSRFCPTCGTAGDRPDEISTLDGHLEVLAAIYASDTFLEPRAPADPELRQARRPFMTPSTHTATTAIAASRYLQRLTGLRPRK
jgi:predicted membrane-bound spermidine synthase